MPPFTKQKFLGPSTSQYGSKNWLPKVVFFNEVLFKNIFSNVNSIQSNHKKCTLKVPNKGACTRFFDHDQTSTLHTLISARLFIKDFWKIFVKFRAKLKIFAEIYFQVTFVYLAHCGRGLHSQNSTLHPNPVCTAIQFLSKFHPGCLLGYARLFGTLK